MAVSFLRKVAFWGEINYNKPGYVEYVAVRLGNSFQKRIRLTVFENQCLRALRRVEISMYYIFENTSVFSHVPPLRGGTCADMAQSVAHLIGSEEVTSSILVVST